MKKREFPCRVGVPFFSTGTYVLITMMGIGFTFGLARFITGLGAVTHLTNQFPWGIWIAIDVACGVALASGGFTSAALIDIFGSKRYKPLLRPAILTAWLGYAMVGFALIFDLGRYWNMWRPVIDWQGNSVLFEVGMCVMAYLTVLTVEMSPALLAGLRNRIARNEWGAGVLRRVEGPIITLHRGVKTALPIFIIAGVVLSCMHQSSLGTLMVIAPTKLSPFWYTAILPILFLLSAIMVGFPMVIFESILANRSVGRKPEMDVLAPLARKIPYIMGLYMIVKFGDLILRHKQLDAVHHPGCTLALSVEIIFGLLVPFFMLMFKTVRRSPGWLFTTNLLIILGVAFNRINVFLVGFHPPFAKVKYFPSIAEIAVTTAIICTIMFLYRVFIVYFPILTGPECVERFDYAHRDEPVSEKLAWVFRGVGVFFLLSFVLIYAVVHKESIERSTQMYRGMVVPQSVTVIPTVRKIESVSHALRPKGYMTTYLLNSPILNKVNNDYEPVRFSHRSHDNYTHGNCAVCHHRITFDSDDRVGQNLTAMHRDFDVDLGPACSSCHGDMDSNRPEACSQCHHYPNEPDDPTRPGLKGAYHRQCIGCHESLPSSAHAPTDCKGCHYPNPPDHSKLISVKADASPQDVTKNCLGCHAKEGEDIITSVHWNWGGHSPNVMGHEHAVHLGLRTVMNNYMLSIGSNVAYCASCHIGYGWFQGPFDFSDESNIDCLICHDTSGAYKKDEAGGGNPDVNVDLKAVAQSVGRPSRETCGRCHFYSDGGPNWKQGDLEPILASPPPDFDIHMGRNDMRCQECHTTSHHEIAGRSLSAPAAEGSVTCMKCHGSHPHGVSGILAHHLDAHVKTVACETCHIPFVAKDSPTQIFLDYSRAGEDRKVKKDKYGMPTYDRRFGEMRWTKDLVPTYTWYNGKKSLYILGEKMNSTDLVYVSRPIGEMQDPVSKIYPFKVHDGVQPYDTQSRILVAPRMFEGFWKDFNWEKAIEEGMKSVGVDYSGSYDFVKSKMYISLHHEVVPEKKALGCTDCHAEQAVTCTRCHSGARGKALPKHLQKSYPHKHFLNFKALGYKGDPARTGGRFYVKFGRGTPPM